jgi:hypothetical protein
MTTINISIQNFGFGTGCCPTEGILPGDTIVWTNNHVGIQHTVTSDTGIFASPILNPGDTFTYTFNDLGQFYYHCTIHTSMKALVNVAIHPPGGSHVPPEYYGILLFAGFVGIFAGGFVLGKYSKSK